MKVKDDSTIGKQIIEYLRTKQREEAALKTTYCTCCGAKRIGGVGECYTDCMWYDGPLPPDAHPH